LTCVLVTHTENDAIDAPDVCDALAVYRGRKTAGGRAIDSAEVLVFAVSEA
jgi:hypothetical protein